MIDTVYAQAVLIHINSAAANNLACTISLYNKKHPDYVNIPKNVINSMRSILRDITELNDIMFKDIRDKNKGK